MMLWLYLHYPSLQLDSLFADTGSGEQAAVIIHGKRHQVLQLNGAALSHGVRPGMGLGMASALCSELKIHTFNPQTGKDRLREIAHWLYSVTADIALFEPDGLLLRVSNMLSLYGGLDSYWEAICSHLRPLPFQYHYATGRTPLASRLLARSGDNVVSDDDALLWGRVKRHSLAVTELSPETVGKLGRLGIRTLADLFDLPLNEVARRFDSELVHYLGRLTGQLKHPLHFYHPPDQFECSLDLLFEVDNVQWLHKPLLRLLSRLESFLTCHDQVACELALLLHYRSVDSLRLSVASVSGECRVDPWFSLLTLKLDRVVLPAAVTGITLKAVRLAYRTNSERDFFDGVRGNQTPQELVSLLQAKLGEEAVRGITLTGDPRPAQASQLCDPLTVSLPVPSNPHLVRPSFLFPVPVSLKEKVQIVQGPERLTTGWWDGKPVHRDYFVARSGKGQWLWVFRTEQQRWFVQGLFS